MKPIRVNDRQEHIRPSVDSDGDRTVLSAIYRLPFFVQDRNIMENLECQIRLGSLNIHNV